MAVKSGVSHVLAAVVVLVVGPIVNELVSLLVDGQDVIRAIEAASAIVADHPFVAAGDDTVATALTLATLVVFLYVWGHAYHVKRHG